MDEWIGTCQACKKKRMFKHLDVRIFDLSEFYNLPEGTVQENYCYCNDDKDCIETAKNKKKEELQCQTKKDDGTVI